MIFRFLHSSKLFDGSSVIGIGYSIALQLSEELAYT